MQNKSSLLFQFLLICAVVYLKLRAESAYFLTPDSHYYLQAAQNLLAGNGYRIVFEGKETFCAIWPVGYSALIAGVSALSTFSVETASKIVNLMALAGCFWLIYRRFQDKAWFVALGLMTSSLVQLYTNTWSETVFLFFVLGFTFSPFSKWIGIASDKGQGAVRRRDEVLWAMGAFLIRYAALFLLIPLLIRRKFRAVIYYLLFISGYLLYNFYQTHTFTGGHGFWPEEPMGVRVWRGIRGLGEEILFFAVRDWDLKRLTLSASAQWFIYGVALLQLLILTTICWFVGPSVKPVFKNGLKILFRRSFGLQIRNGMTNVFFLVGISYLLFTIVIYVTDASIESLYFRRLAPASLLFTLGILGWVSQQKDIFEKTKWLFVAFFALSIIHALPK